VGWRRRIRRGRGGKGEKGRRTDGEWTEKRREEREKGGGRTR
jgi:hypothetical protein